MKYFTRQHPVLKDRVISFSPLLFFRLLFILHSVSYPIPLILYHQSSSTMSQHLCLVGASMVTSAAYEDDVECYWYERPLAQPLKVHDSTRATMHSLTPLTSIFYILYFWNLVYDFPKSLMDAFLLSAILCLSLLPLSFASLFCLPFLPPPFPHRYLSFFFMCCCCCRLLGNTLVRR